MEALRSSPIATSAPQPEQLAPAPVIASQFGITRRTLSRWIVDDALGLPRPVEINKRLYFKQHEIDAWKISRARRDTVKEAA